TETAAACGKKPAFAFVHVDLKTITVLCLFEAAVDDVGQRNRICLLSMVVRFALEVLRRKIVAAHGHKAAADRNVGRNGRDQLESRGAKTLAQRTQHG